MREIKFRLRYDNAIVGYEKWYRGSYDGDFCNAKPQWLYSEDGEYWNPDYISHRHKDEFTGLKDKNGKEIYEGDVVCTFFTGGPKVDEVYKKAEVKWGVYNVGVNGGEYDMKVVGPYIEDEYLYGEMIDGNSTILGNIYENPELLK